MFDVEVEGELGMFTTPQSKLQCERVSYPMPTYSALQGIMTSIYRQRGMKWVIKECRVMNPIEYIDIGTLYSSYRATKGRKRPRFIYSYLKNPRYQIRAYYVRDNRYITSAGFHFGHGNTIREILEKGNGEFIKLGSGNCLAYFKSCVFGDGHGYYDEDGEGEPVRMFYDFLRENGDIKYAGFCLQKMKNGIISFTDIPVVYRKWRV